MITIFLMFSLLVWGQEIPIIDDETILYVNSKETFNKQIEMYKGRLIYVDLWATYCGSCIKQFKYKNELESFFKENNIVSLNLCIDAEKNKKRWQDIIEKHSLNGYNVFVNSKSIEKYRSGLEMSAKFYNYFGGLFPQFLIIDKHGNIVEEYAELPSKKEKLEMQLRKYIE